MAIPLFLPRREVDLLLWSRNYDQLTNETPEAYGLTVEQCAHYSVLHAQFEETYKTARQPDTNSRSATAGKNTARDALIAEAKGLVAIVQAFPGTTDAMRSALGLRIRDANPSPIPPPDSPPILTVLYCLGRRARLRLLQHDVSGRRGKPAGALGATILIYAGTHPPADPYEWRFAMNASRPEFDLVFPWSIPPGAKVWITAMWFNARMQTSEPAAERSVYVTDSPGEFMRQRRAA